MIGKTIGKRATVIGMSAVLVASTIVAPVAVQPQKALAASPAKVKIKSGSFRMSGGADYIRTAKLTWKKASKAKGYQVKMKGYWGGRNAGYGSWENLGTTKKTSYKKVWRGAKYLVGGLFKVRAYSLTKSGKRTYGKWSTAKRIMTPGW